MNRKFIFIFNILLLLAINSYSQFNSFTIDSVVHNLFEQVRIFPQEKIYIQNDKPYYVAGENIWFRAHLIESTTHMPSKGSRYIYVELLNPINQLVSQIKIKSDKNGDFYGHTPLYEKLPEGSYTIRAYTNFMRNQGEDYFFHKAVYVGGPLSSKMEAKATFSFTEDNKIRTKISLINKNSQHKIYSEDVIVQVNDKNIQTVKMQKDSVAYITLELPKNSEYRQLYVEAENHKQFISIPSSSNDYHVSFFPEGGYLIQGVNNRLAFKSLQSNGLSNHVEGKIVDEENNWICNIETVHNGMGVCQITPETGKKYYVICVNEDMVEKRFILPAAINNSYGLATNWVDDQLFISVRQSPENQAMDYSPVYLLIHKGGIPYYIAEWDKNKEFISFDKNLLPYGILQVLLLDNTMEPLNERLAFCMKENDTKIESTFNKLHYNIRDRIHASFTINDKDGKPLEGSFSVSVTDDKDVLPDSIYTIASTLLLSSEIKGNIENPGYYFSNDKLAPVYLDLLMMIHGWQRYNIAEAIKGNFEYPNEYLEFGQEVSGLVKGLGFSRRKKQKKAIVNIMIPSMLYINSVEADEMGRFKFNGFDFPDSTNFVIQATDSKESDYVELILDRDTFPRIEKYIPAPFRIKEKKIFDNYILKAEQKYSIENGIRMIELDEVIVKSRKIEKNSEYGVFTDKSYSAERIEEMGVFDLHDLLMRTAELRYRGRSFFYRSSWMLPLIVIDGQFIERQAGDFMVGANMPSNTVHAQAINNYTRNIMEYVTTGYEFDFDYTNIDIKNIRNVSIIPPERSSVMFGNRRASGGAIIITTKTKSGLMGLIKPKLNLAEYKPLGYQRPVEFYSPKYETIEQLNDPTPDLRTTIYWKPNVITSPNGKASFEFYSADAPTTYSVVLEGVSKDGRIIRKTDKITIK